MFSPAWVTTASARATAARCGAKSVTQVAPRRSQRLRLARVEPAAVGDEELRVERPAGQRDAPEEPEAPALQRAERGEDERPVGAHRQRQRRLVGRRRAQRPDVVQVRRRGGAREIEAGRRLAELQQRRQALVEPLARREPEGARVRADDARVRAHQPVVDAAAAAVEVQAALVGGVGPGHHRQRQRRLAVDRQGARHRHARQAERLGDEPAGGLHLVGDDSLGADVAQHRRRLAAQHVGRGGHVADDAAQAERPARPRRARDQRGEGARRVRARADGVEVAAARAEQRPHVVLLHPARPVAARGERVGQRFEGADVAGEGRGEDGVVGHGRGTGRGRRTRLAGRPGPVPPRPERGVYHVTRYRA